MAFSPHFSVWLPEDPCGLRRLDPFGGSVCVDLSTGRLSLNSGKGINCLVDRRSFHCCTGCRAQLVNPQAFAATSKKSGAIHGKVKNTPRANIRIRLIMAAIFMSRNVL
jgi:hypothetical protein